MDIIQIPTTQTPGAGLGDVVGPASSTDNAIVRYDTTTGRLLQNSTVTIADSGDVSISSTTAGASGAGALVVQGGISAGQSAQASYFGGSISFPSDTGIISSVNNGRLFLDGSANREGGSINLYGSAGAFPAQTIYTAATHVYKNINGTQQLSLSLTDATFAGAVSVGTGAAVGGATAGAGGLAFPATAVGVANANTLDDYEEGTFTPIVSDAATGGNLATLSDAEGVYTKIGNIVYWRFNVVLTSKASASAGNTVFIQGLPFQSATIPNGWYNPNPTIIRNITFSGYVQFNVSGANSYGFFRENVSNAAGDDIIFSDLTNSAAMQASGFYKVA